MNSFLTAFRILRKNWDEAAKFFQELSEDGSRTFREAENNPEENLSEDRVYKDLAMQERVVLFCLKGEIQKLGEAHLDTKQKTAFRAICSKIDKAIKVSLSSAKEEKKNNVEELLFEAYDELTKKAEKLNPHGGAIQYLAEKMKMPLKYLSKEE